MKSKEIHFELNGRSYCGTDRGENAATKVELSPNAEDTTCRSCLRMVNSGQAPKPKSKTRTKAKKVKKVR